MTEPPNDEVQGHPKEDEPVGKTIAAFAVGFASLVAIVAAVELLSGESPHFVPYDDGAVNGPLNGGFPPPDPYDDAPVNTPSPTGEYTPPGEVTIDPSLPDALPLPDGIWDLVEPGWVLVDYMPVILGQSDYPPRSVLEHTKHVVYLISPDGTRYQVAELDPHEYVTITAWTAGETVAYINLCDEPGPCSWQPTRVLDLETGTVSSAGVPWGGSNNVQFISTLPDGSRLWAARGSGGGYLETGGQGNRSWTKIDQGWETFYPVAASPDGNYLALGASSELSPGQTEDGNRSEVLIMSLTGQEDTRTPMLGGDWGCVPRDWLTPTRLAIRCGSNDEMSNVYYIYDLVTGELTPGFEGQYNDDVSRSYGDWPEPYVRRDLQLDYGLYAGLYVDAAPVEGADQGESCAFGVDDHGALTCVVLPDPTGDSLHDVDLVTHVGSMLYLLADYAGYYEAGETIVVYDVDTGSQRTLIGPPTAGPTFGWNKDEDEGVWAYAVLSWAVAH